MKYFFILIALFISGCGVTSAPKLPIQSGQYIFHHKFAEQPTMPSITLTAIIDGDHIVLINEDEFDVFPKGVLVDGTIMWHEKSRQWIIGHSESDRFAPEVGGCSEGPEVIDLEKRIYWTC